KRSSGSWRRRWCGHDTPWGYGWPRAVASGAPRLDLPPMDPSGRPRSIPDGATCTACGAPVPTGRIRILATRDDLAFVELVCDDCGSAALGMLLATTGHDDGPVLAVAPDGPLAPVRSSSGGRSRPIDAADVEALR